MGKVVYTMIHIQGTVFNSAITFTNIDQTWRYFDSIELKLFASHILL